jgi:hypothetical protein
MLPYITSQFTILDTRSFPELTAMGKDRVYSRDDNLWHRLMYRLIPEITGFAKDKT